jgi:hypothetical protein
MHENTGESSNIKTADSFSSVNLTPEYEMEVKHFLYSVWQGLFSLSLF